MRVVVDTNIIVSGLFWQGSPATVYNAAVKQAYTWLVTDAMLAELERVLRYPKFAPRLAIIRKTPDDLIIDFRTFAELVTPAEIPSVSVRDPKDVIVLACAVGGKADFIVSGDNDLLVLGIYANIPILSVEQFLQRLLSD